jgi:phage tail protein X
MRVITRQGDTVDALCFRHLGRSQGVVEIVLEQNPGLADHGPILPHGLQVDLPDTTTQPTNTPTLLRLWD